MPNMFLFTSLLEKTQSIFHLGIGPWYKIIVQITPSYFKVFMIYFVLELQPNFLKVITE